MRALTVPALLAAALTLAACASAQDTAPSTSPELRQELKQKRYLVLPKPSPETVSKDTDQAINDMPGHTDQLIRDSRQRPLSRPELDSSVVNDIQADRALRLPHR
jgi:hypothetical protein